MSTVYETARRLTSYVDSTGQKKTGVSDWKRLKREYARAYRVQREENARALAAAEEQTRQDTAGQIRALRGEYQDTGRQLYRDYMLRQKALPEQLAARGYTGGLTESGYLRLGNAYAEALAANERARLGQEAAYEQALARQLTQARSDAAAADSRARQAYYEQRADLTARRQQQERAALERRAATLATQGDFRLYKQLGYTDREIRYLQRMFRRQHPKLA